MEFTLDTATNVQIALTVILPILVGLVTTRITSSGTKAWLLAALTLVTSLLVEFGRAVESGTTYDLGTALQMAVPAFAISVATHYGLWKPTGVTQYAAEHLRKAPPEYEVGDVDDTLPVREEPEEY